VRRFALITSIFLLASTVRASESGWTSARNGSFEIYSQAGAANARDLLRWFDRLHTFFEQQTGLSLDRHAPLRVLVFDSFEQYQTVRLKPNTSAYYLATDSNDYIVLSSPRAPTVATHEYWHFVEHTEQLHLPAALNEGLAEFFSTVQIDADRARIGAVAPARLRTLQTRTWTPLRTLLTTGERDLPPDLEASEMFYSEAWALGHMLMLAPDYAPHFRELVERLSAKVPVQQVMESTYSKPLSRIATDLREWVRKLSSVPSSVQISLASGSEPFVIEEADQFSVRSLMAQVLIGSGRAEEAEEIYEDLARQAPKNPGISAARSLLALQQRDLPKARLLWQRALDDGIRDARVCYRFAQFGEAAGMSEAEIRPALERAVASDPSLDDALFKLALIEKAAGERKLALDHLQAMHQIVPARRYLYWILTSDLLNEFDRREEARAAAERAKPWAATTEQRNAADQLAYMAQTDLTVRLSRDSNGTTRMETARVRHGSSDWNPFVEPGDRVRRIEGQLREVECGEAQIVFVVEMATGGVVRIRLGDPARVQMKNAPAEFTCGGQNGAPVVAVYAETGESAGLLRGMEFK